ncbi:hypothetical protein JHK85_036577 [Glycine max]|nr:hypothetical protein JHK85_036577 [Glycine max]
MSFSKGSPGSQTPQDIEAGSRASFSADFDDGDFSADPFDVPRTKNAPVQRLRRWRAIGALSCRILGAIPFLSLLYAAYRFKEAGQMNGTIKPPSSSTGEFSVGQEQLSSISRDRDATALQENGGVVGLSHLLKTNLEKGIQGDDADLLKRRSAFGSNNYPRKSGRSFLMFMWDACKDLTLIILMVAAVASLALGIKSEGLKEGWYDGGSIAFAVILVILVTAISDYKQSLQFQDLNEHKRNIHLEVIRDGRRVEISIYDVVVGDVIPLNIGNQVPADGVLITGHSLAIDESSMTGESKIVEKNSNDPFLISGCKVADGSGTMLVTAVGINTEWGLLMTSISEDNGEETPLQVRLNGLTTLIGIVGLFVAVVVLMVLLARYFSGHTRNPDGSVQFIAGKTKVGDAIDGVIKIFTVAVTIVVIAVPEGLPLAVTLTLAYSMKKMMADKALVRRLSACETMGSATTICSDKTGTLTMNQMTVVEAWIGGGKKIVPPYEESKFSHMLCSLLIEGVAQNTNGSVYIAEGGNDVEVSGSPTEKAILEWGIKLGMNFDTARSDSSIIHVFPFNSDKKRGGVATRVVKMVTGDNVKTARAIAVECGILGSISDATEPIIIEGKNFRALTEEGRADIVEKILVMGRSSPNDKLLLVQALRRKGHVVAVTGDGTNDAPALHEADIGLAMGIQGTEVAKESSDIIILDDNFASVVKVVKWGRSVYANIQKFIQFQLTVNIAALAINVVAAFSTGDIPLNTVQLLWVNLIMDTLGALALATEPPTDSLMDQSPKGQREPLVSNIMWRNLLIQAMYQLSVLLILNFRGVSLLGLRDEPNRPAIKVKNSLIFNAFVLCQVFNEFNARKPDKFNIFKGVTRNYLFMGIVGITVVLQIVIVEYLGKFTKTAKLNWKQWLISVIIAFISWPLAVVGKLIRVPKAELSFHTADNENGAWPAQPLEHIYPHNMMGTGGPSGHLHATQYLLSAHQPNSLTNNSFPLKPLMVAIFFKFNPIYSGYNGVDSEVTTSTIAYKMKSFIKDGEEAYCDRIGTQLKTRCKGSRKQNKSTQEKKGKKRLTFWAEKDRPTTGPDCSSKRTGQLWLMWKTTPITLIFLAAMSLCLDPPAVLSFGWNFINTLGILTSAFLGFLLQWSGALALGATSAVLHVVLEQFKTCIILLGNYYLFGSNPGIISICGAFAAIAGMSVYTYLNLKQQSNKIFPRQATLLPKSKLSKENGTSQN